MPDPASGSLAILVVDDNEDAATLLAASLSMKGHRVRVALDGPAALVAATEFQPAVAVLDIGLPGWMATNWPLTCEATRVGLTFA